MAKSNTTINTTDYDIVAEKFTQHKEHFSQTDRLGIDYIKKQLDDVLKGKKLLDFGCGDGTNALNFSNDGFQIIGVDTSKVLIDKA